MTRQYLKDKRVETIIELQEEIMSWSDNINEKQRGVDWQMKVDGARIKLKSVYPKFKV
jgi:hypothetical protein